MLWRLRDLLALQNILIAIVPLATIAFFTLFWIAPQLRSEVERHHLVTARIIASQISAQLNDAQHELLSLLYLPTNTQRAGPHWQQALSDNAHRIDRFSNVLVVDSKGIAVAVGLRPTLQAAQNSYLGTDISQRPFFAKAKVAQRPFWSNTYLSITTGEPSVAMVAPLPEGGLLVGELELTQLSRFIGSGNSRAGKLTIMLIDGDGLLVAHPDSTLSSQQLNLSQLPIVEDAFIGISKVQSFEFLGEELVGTAVPVEEVGWVVLAAQPPDTAYWLTSLSANAMFTSTIVALSAAVFGGILLANYQAQRIGWYEDIAGNISRGKFNLQWPKSKIKEFSNLISDLRNMATAIQLREGRLKIQRDELQHYREELEERVKSRTAELKAANQELESFSYSVSHDLRAPLRTMDGFSSLLLEEYGDSLDEKALDYLMRIKRGSDRMASLIENILHLSRLNQKELYLKDVNLSEIARQELATIHGADPDRTVTVSILPTHDSRGDPQLLSIAIKNLLDNALKYTGRTTAPHIEFGDVVCNGQTVYYVQDNGVGFDMHYSKKLFSAFQRLHKAEQFPGDGIGLAIVKRVITRHGGTIWADAEINRGATFFFTLS